MPFHALSIHFNAQSRQRGECRERPFDHERVPGDRDLVVVRSQHVAGETFDLHVRRRDDEVQHRGRPDIPLQVRANRTRDPMLCGEVCDLAALPDSAVLARIEADRIAAFVTNQFLRVDQVEATFVGENRRAGLAAHTCQPRVVSRWDRLFDQRQVAVTQLANAADRGLDIPAAVRVDGQSDVGADRVAHDSHPLDIARRIDTHFDLDRREARRDQLTRAASSTLGIVSSQ